jgi:MFS family permease
MSVLNSSIEPGKSTKAERYSAFTALRYRDFRLLWLGQMVSVTGSQMQLVAVNWHVWILTKSALALGMVGLFRAAPIILCSLAGGVFADAVDRKRLMIVTQSTMLASAACLALVTVAGSSHVWPIYLLTAIASAASAFDTPARQALMTTLVPARDLPNAVSLGVTVFYIAMIGGPSLAGLLLASHGPAIVYAVNAASYLAVIAALIAMRISGRAAAKQGEATSQVSLSALKEGLSFVRRTPIIVQTMTLDFAATFFASATALLPIFADKVLNVGARGFGILAAAPAIGAVLTGLVMARLGNLRRQGKLVIWSVAVFGLATIGFGLSHTFWLSLLMLGVAGAADTVSTVLRQTIRQLVTPDYLRGRITSINMVFFMGGPQLGELEAGAVAALIGASLSVVTGGVGSVLAALIALLTARSLRNYDSA